MKLQHYISSLIILFLFTTLFTGCAHDERAEKAIAEAKQLLDAQPDSALSILDGIKEGKASWPKAQRMQYELVYAQAQNKAFVDFTTDSIVLEVAKYYDKHGSSNERMMANYLVGCAYRDLGDAPTALKYMNIAIDAVDENSKDCDLSTLMRIHSQMGGLYHDVAAFENERNENNRAEQIAWQIGDTISALNLKWYKACSLYDSRQQSAAIEIIDSLDDFIRDYHLAEEPSLIYPIKIDDKLQRGNFNEAGKLIAIYERKMGITPLSHDDDITDPIYFQNKGRYYAMIQKVDSSIVMYQRLLDLIKKHRVSLSERYGLLESSYRGLMNAYSLKQQPDSTIKYANLYCILNDSTTKNLSSEQLLRMQSLYNYSKIQEQALIAEHSVSKLRVMMLILISVAILVCIILWGMYQKHIRIEKQRQIDANKEYQALLSELEKSADELRLFKADSDRFLQEKEKEIQKLQKSLTMYQANTMDVEQWDNERSILGCDIAAHLHTLSAHGETATLDELNSLSLVAEKGFPKFYATITRSKFGLSALEITICILIRFHFIPSEITVLTGHSSQRITNLKSAINKKVFSTQGAKTLDAHLLALK